jgi:hypothetical protein
MGLKNQLTCGVDWLPCSECPAGTLPGAGHCRGRSAGGNCQGRPEHGNDVPQSRTQRRDSLRIAQIAHHHRKRRVSTYCFTGIDLYQSGRPAECADWPLPAVFSSDIPFRCQGESRSECRKAEGTRTLVSVSHAAWPAGMHMVNGAAPLHDGALHLTRTAQSPLRGRLDHPAHPANQRVH